jgi:plastocyanin
MLFRSWLQKSMCIGLTLAALAACGDDETTTSTNGTGASGATGGNGGDGGDGGATGGGGSGGGATGCTSATATDSTGQAMVSLTWTLPYTDPNKCTRVDVGTDVAWNGDFTVHPLEGGTPGMSDATSPITTTMAMGMTKTVRFDTAGDYPYFCTIHGVSMTGTIFVE